MAQIEIKDVQGIVLRGYDELPHLSFILLSARNADADVVRAWLGTLLAEVTSAADVPGETAVNVGFTQAGMLALGLSPATVKSFAREFRDDDLPGDKHRNRILGDEGDSHPERWEWGGPFPRKGERAHIALMLYARNESTFLDHCREHERRFQKAGLEEIVRIATHVLTDRKEHFGFRDGISQPWLENDNPPAERVELLVPRARDNSVRPGEFLYGYQDEYGDVHPSPQVPPSLDPDGILVRDGTGISDFGRNGTYLVARQLEQNVKGFWDFVFAGGERVGQDPVELAAKMVGRWPNGAPLVKAPNAPVDSLRDDADFSFRSKNEKDDDAAGYKCPLGSHIRRANPRDALVDVDDPDESIRIVKRHRLIRRGRPYGPPVDRSMDPEAVRKAKDDGAERGLLFLAFNLHLGRQFEFVQQTWINNPKFGNLFTDADPIAGSPEADSTFTQQRRPVRRRITGIKSFVRVRGSGYFFMPGLAALRYLAEGIQPARGVVPRLPIGVDRPAERPEDRPLDSPPATETPPTRPVTGGTTV